MPETVHLGVLWTGLLGPPILWLTQFEINFALVPVACASGVAWPLYLVTAITLLLTAICGTVAWRSRADAEYARFLSLAGAGLSSLFFLATVAQSIFTVVLHPCQ